MQIVTSWMEEVIQQGLQPYTQAAELEGWFAAQKDEANDDRPL